MKIKLLHIYVLLIFVVGGIGGGYTICLIMQHFHISSILVDIIGLVYWCSYGLLFTKVELNSDKKTSYQKGYAEGYVSGHDEGLSMGISAGQREYDRGYNNGLLDGRADGWDYGYECCKKDNSEQGAF